MSGLIYIELETNSASRVCLRAHYTEGRSRGIPTDVGVYSMSEEKRILGCCGKRFYQTLLTQCSVCLEREIPLVEFLGFGNRFSSFESVGGAGRNVFSGRDSPGADSKTPLAGGNPAFFRTFSGKRGMSISTGKYIY